MKRIALLGVCALFVCGLSGIAGAQVVHVSFDTTPDGRAIVSGTAVNTL